MRIKTQVILTLTDSDYSIGKVNIACFGKTAGYYREEKLQCLHRCNKIAQSDSECGKRECMRGGVVGKDIWKYLWQKNSKSEVKSLKDGSDISPSLWLGDSSNEKDA